MHYKVNSRERYDVNLNTQVFYAMKPEQIYQHLKDLAEKLDLSVSEKNFKNVGMNIQSGFCVVKDKNMFIMDKHLPIQKKISIMASYLGKMPYDSIYLLPAIREILEKHSQGKRD